MPLYIQYPVAACFSFRTRSLQNSRLARNPRTVAVSRRFCGESTTCRSSVRTARRGSGNLAAKDPAANPVVLGGHEDAVNAVTFSPDNHWLVTGSEDNTARLWDLTVKDPAASPVVLRGHKGAVGGGGDQPG
jgi:WD40 repeat protein